MEKEHYERWEPLDNIPRQLLCEGLIDDSEGLKVFLKGMDSSAPIFRITFGSYLAYRNMDEGSKIRTWNRTTGREICPLYIVSHSLWLDWFHEESSGIYNDMTVMHYAIFTECDCIDVLTLDEPEAEWLDASSDELNFIFRRSQ